MNKLSPLILLLAVAAGFGLIVAEHTILGHTQGARATGYYAAIGGTVLGIVAALVVSFVGNPLVGRIVAVVFALLAITGVMGVNAHAGGQVRRAGVVAGIQPPLSGPAGQLAGTFQRMPPTLAPLMLSGLSLFGAYVTFVSAGAARKRENS